MPNNQFRAFRSGSNTFSQRTYKHQVHPKRRVVFQRNQQSGFKNKIQIKGQIPKPLHGPNSFIFKRLEENNSKQISFRHCKRLQHSFHSETNPNLPSTNPVNGSHRGFTDQLRNLPPVREGSNRRGGYVSASLLKQPFPCRQTFRGEKASNKSPTFKQIRSESKIQDGNHFTSTRHFETKQFPHQNRLKRCFLQHPYRQKVKKIPSVYLPQQALPILRPTIQNFNSSSSVFQDFKACYCSSPHKRYISHHLSRRSTHCRRDIHRLSEPYKTSNFSSGIPGFSNQLRKIRNNPSPKARILGLHNRFNLYDSCPPSRENSVDRIVSPKAKKGTISIRQLSRFIVFCTSIKYAVSQATLHYRSLQFLRNHVLKGHRYSPSLYNLKVHLSPEATTDLKWWEDHLQYHSKRPIHINDPDLIITSGASDLSWRAWCGKKSVQGL